MVRERARRSPTLAARTKRQPPTRQFNDQAGAPTPSGLKDQDVYAVNAKDELITGEFLRSYVNTPPETFPYVRVLPANNLMAQIYLGGPAIERANRHYNAGLELEDRGRLPEATDEYGQAVLLNPGLPPAYVNRGSTSNRLSQHRRAIEDLS